MGSNNTNDSSPGRQLMEDYNKQLYLIAQMLITLMYPCSLILGFLGGILSCLCLRQLRKSTHPETRLMMYLVAILDILALFFTFLTRSLSF